MSAIKETGNTVMTDTLPETEPIVTIKPLRRLAMFGMTACAKRKTAKVFISKLRRTWSMGTSKAAPIPKGYYEHRISTLATAFYGRRLTCTNSTGIVDQDIDSTFCVYDVFDDHPNVLVTKDVQDMRLDIGALKALQGLQSTCCGIDYTPMGSEFFATV